MNMRYRRIVGMAKVKFFNRESGTGVIDLDDGTEPMQIELEAAQMTPEILGAKRLAYALDVPEVGAPWLSELRVI